VPNPTSVVDKDRPSPEQPDTAVEPLWVRPAIGMRLIGCKMTKFYSLLNSGAIESRRVGGMRLCSFESLKRLGLDTGDGDPA